ncbi:MAG: caspase family protein [Firmicutes bacterium]|jgi:hypothetical protein|nr:caspase family protein [Bacillota bacterium]
MHRTGLEAPVSVERIVVPTRVGVNRLVVMILLVGLLGAGCAPGVLVFGSISGWAYKDSQALSLDGEAVEKIVIMAEQTKSATYSPLQGATVLVQGPTSTQVTTNSSGYFSATSLRPGSYKVTVYHPQYVDWLEVHCTVFPGLDTYVGTRVLGSLHILTIGINEYEGDPSNRLRFAVADAIAARDSLYYGNFLAGQYVQLTDTQAKKLDIIKAIQVVGSRTNANDTFIMFYSGHGAQDGSISPAHEYIIAQDLERISDEELSTWISLYVNAGRRIFVFDSCYSGGMFQSLDFGKNLKRSTGFEVMAKNLSQAGNIVITASAKNEVSWEDGALGRGVFSYYFTQGFDQRIVSGGKQYCVADADRNDLVDATEIYNYVRDQMRAYFGGLPPYPQNPQIYYGPPGSQMNAYLYRIPR